MSLHVLANHMAAHGRGPDSMLVHMSPQEVQSLQELAMKNGGSLTINPQTGLPEAGFLDSILPVIAGIALGPAGFGLLSAGMAGAAVGGVTALATGSLEKGLMAGMGAYGGAGLGEALMGSAAGATTAELAAKSAVEDQSMAEASRLAGKEIAAQTPFQQISTGVQGLGTEAGRTGALDAVGGGMGALKYGAAAIAPIMADQMVQTTTQAPSTNTGYIRQKVYDPISGTYTDVGPVKASDWGSRSFSDLRRGYADGGIVALARGDLIEDTPAAAPAAPAAPTYTDQQIQDAIAASRQQGFNNDQILQGAKANYGVDVSRFLAPATPAPVANQAAAKSDYTLPSGDVIKIPAGTTGSMPPAATTGITGGLGALAANQIAAQTVTPGANNTTSGTTGDSGILTALANKGAQTVVGTTTAPADQQALALQAAQAGINAGKTPAQIAAEVNAQYGKNFTAQNVSDFAAANAPALNKAGLSNAAIYAATNPEFKGVAGGTGLAGLNANIKAAMEQTAKDKPNATAAEIKSILAGYGADSSDFQRAMGMTPEQWDAAHGIINQPPNSTVIGGAGTDTVKKDEGVITETGKVLPVVTLSDGTKLVVNPTQVATTGVTAPTVLNEAARTALPVGVSGNQTATINPNGTVSMNTGTPNMPVGGYTGMESLRNAYTKGGGSLGYTPYTPKTMAEFNAKYTNTGDTKSAYDYLMGKGAYPTKSNVGQIMRPYAEATLGMPAAGNRPTIWDQASGRYINNPDYVRPMRDSAGKVTYGMSQKELTAFLTDQAKNPTMSGQELYDWAVKNNVSAQDIADARGVPLSEVYAQFRNFKQAADAKKATDAADTTTTTTAGNKKLAGGGITGSGQLNLNIPLNLGGGNTGGAMGSGGAMGGGFSQAPMQQQQQMQDPRLADISSQIDKLPSVMQYQSYSQALGNRAPTADEAAQLMKYQQAIQSDQDFLGLQDKGRLIQQSLMRGIPQAPSQYGSSAFGGPSIKMAAGGYAVGGGLGSLGSYSDGGRLLRGPGDGVSDSIPASIGQSQQPARLADGEFVVPARIVSELGNGSTEAGARKLYAMMDRVQRARGKTTGKNRVAANTSADKYLPA